MSRVYCAECGHHVRDGETVCVRPWVFPVLECDCQCFGSPYGNERRLRDEARKLARRARRAKFWFPRRTYINREEALAAQRQCPDGYRPYTEYGTGEANLHAFLTMLDDGRGQ